MSHYDVVDKKRSQFRDNCIKFEGVRHHFRSYSMYINVKIVKFGMSFMRLDELLKGVNHFPTFYDRYADGTRRTSLAVGRLKVNGNKIRRYYPNWRTIALGVLVIQTLFLPILGILCMSIKSH